MSHTVSIPFQPMPHQMLFLTSRQEAQPDEAQLMQRVSDGVHAHLKPALAQELLAYVAAGGAKITVVDAADPNIRQFIENARALDGRDDPLSLEGVRWCIIIGAQGVMVPPVLHVWFCRVAAYVLAEHFGEPVTDAVSLLVDPRYSDAGVIKGSAGKVHLSRHLRLLAPAAKPGNARLRTLGMHDFGLPELEIGDCPAALLGAAQLILTGTAQYLLEAAMARAPQLDDEEAASVHMLELPDEFILTRALMDAAMGVGAQGEIQSTRLRLNFVPGETGKFAVVQIVAPRELAEEGDDWLDEVVARLAPAA